MQNINKKRLLDQLKKDEGVVYVIYLDHLGYKTFGIGHLVTENDPEYELPVGHPISKQRVESAFNSDVDTAISECVVLYGEETFNNFPVEVREILINMMFQLGRPNLSKFKKMNAHLRNRDWQAAADEGLDSLWARQTPNRANRLMDRLRAVN